MQKVFFAVVFVVGLLVGTIDAFAQMRRPIPDAVLPERNVVRPMPDAVRQDAARPAPDAIRPDRDAIRENLIQRREEARRVIEERREAIRVQVEGQQQVAREAVEAGRVELRERLRNIRDERRREAVGRIYEQINALNRRLTDRFLATLNQIEEALGRVKLRTDNAEANGLDVAVVRSAIANAEQAIADSRAAVALQAGKIYEMVITTEEALRVDVGAVRQMLRQDLAAVRDTVFAARNAVREAAVALAQIPRINDAEVTPAPEAVPTPSP